MGEVGPTVGSTRLEEQLGFGWSHTEEGLCFQSNQITRK